MKAFVVTHYGPDGLAAAEVRAPDVGPHDVLVEVRAASINPLDKSVRNGRVQAAHQVQAAVRPRSRRLAGVITQVGAAARGFQVGDEVWSRPRDLRIGTFAEQIAAWQVLVDLADIQPGLHLRFRGEDRGNGPRRAGQGQRQDRGCSLVCAHGHERGRRSGSPGVGGA